MSSPSQPRPAPSGSTAGTPRLRVSSNPIRHSSIVHSEIGHRNADYVSQTALKGGAPDNPALVHRIAAAEIEGMVIAQVRALIRQPEIVVGTWMAARAEAPGLTEEDTRGALRTLAPMWDELFPAEQARIVRNLVERVVIGPDGADIRPRVEGLAGLVRDLGGGNGREAA